MAALELTAETVIALANRPDVVAAFPFLKAVLRPRRSGGCGGCGGGTPPDWRPVAAAVFQLPPARRAAFKALVGVDSVSRRIVRAGRSTTETF